jgi:hypothetical protein
MGTNRAAITTDVNDNITRYLLGLLFSKGFWVLIASIPRDADAIDSMNHAVLNWSTVALNTKIRIANIAKSKIALEFQIQP